MVFSSNLFLFVFLPLFLACYYLTPMRWRSALILLFSYVFYGWWRPDFLWLLAGVTVGSYGFALAIDAALVERRRKALLALAITLNLATLAYFKYANFGVQAFNDLLGLFGVEPVRFAHVLLPIGLSFYIFHAISYLVDIYRREAPPARNLIDFAAFIALFPHLVAGPVLRYHLLAQQFRQRVHSLNRFGKGESEGQGFRAVIEDACMRGIPVLTAVREAYVEAWEAFAGDLGLLLPPDRAAVTGWTDRAIGNAGRRRDAA